jgi:hypothetical protein
MEPGLRRPERDPQLRGDLGQRHPDEVMKDDDGAPFGLEPAEGFVKKLPLGDVRRQVAAEWFGEGRELDLLDTASPPASNVEARVGCQAIEPGVETIRVAQPGQIAPGSDEGVLDRVSRELAVPEDEAGGGVQPREGSAGDRGKGVMIALPRSLDETTLVHCRLSYRRGRNAVLGCYGDGKPRIVPARIPLRRRWPMVRIWSELPGARLKEQIADAATTLWLLFWGSLAWQLFSLLAGFAEAGRMVRGGGQTMIDAGRNLGDGLAGIPLVGPGLRDVARNAFAGAGTPIADFGTSIEQFILIVAAVLALLLVLVTIAPWLTRYLPWRWERLIRMRAGYRAIRKAPEVRRERIEEVLAMRAVSRLDFPTLLSFTPDPLGDFATGRFDRLARAELASVGLRP